MGKAGRKSTPRARRRRPTKKAPIGPAVESPTIGAPALREVPLPRYTLVDDTQRYSEEARAKLKRHIERVDRRRGNTRDVDFWKLLWAHLEIAAEIYARGVAPPQGIPKTTARKTLDTLDKCATAIRTLRKCLTSPELCGSWDFSSSDGLRRAIKAEAPPPQDLIQELSKLQDTVEVDVRELQEVVGGAKMHTFDADDCQTNLIGQVLAVGHQLLGLEKVGHEKGPLVTFLRLALEPVLGRATPSETALRTFARRGLVNTRRNDAC
jgi:hypothetical protein